MKRFLSLTVALCLLLSLGTFACADSPDWASAYAAILDEKLVEARAEQESMGFSVPYWEYTLYDIDKDGVPELFVKMGTCEADFHGEIFTFSDGAARLVCDDLGLGHSSFYTDPGENGVILMRGHMGYAWAERLRLENVSVSFEDLYEDDLNERLQNDPEADYIYPGDVIPGSVYLSMFRLELRLPLARYEEIMNCLAGQIPGEVACGDYPDGDPYFFDRIINSNGEVVAVSADGYAKGPGRIGFQDLMKQNVASDWMDGDMSILSAQLADLNGDGQSECALALSKGENDSEMRCYLSEQDGTVYAYLLNYASQMEVDSVGNLYINSPYYQQPYRLIFDGEEAFLLLLPLEYLKP